MKHFLTVVILRSIVLLQKMIVAHYPRNYPTLMEYKVCYCAHSNLPLVRILSQLNLIRITASLFKILFNVIL
jgi:hypothetical protein